VTSPSDAAAANRLRAGRVLVVGVGGLGHPAALGLATAGVGSIGLVDCDRVDVSNLPRQLLFTIGDLGQPKARIAAERLRQRFGHITIDAFDLRLTAENAAGVLTGYDFVIDATDRPESKFLVHDTAVHLRKPLSHAGVVGERGQALTILPGRSCCLRCLFPQAPTDDEIPTCEAAGVLGPLVGMFGYIQASEAVKCLSGRGDLLTDRLLSVDAGRWRTIALRRDPDCSTCSVHT